MSHHLQKYEDPKAFYARAIEKLAEEMFEMLEEESTHLSQEFDIDKEVVASEILTAFDELVKEEEEE